MIKRALIGLALTSCQLCASPPADKTWWLDDSLSDEFSGTQLDAAKWDVRNLYFKGKKPALYSANNVEVSAGRLHLWARAEDVPNAPPGYHSFTTANITSRARTKYGYFEVSAHPMFNEIVCAFWLYRWMEVGTYEIDIFEIAGGAKGHENIVHTNTHVYQGPPELESPARMVSDPYGWNAGSGLAQRYHTYGLEWNAQELIWFFNGQPIRRKPNVHFHEPMHVKLTCETHPDWTGLPNPQALPAAYHVDYLRAWKPAP